ncbi:MAG: sirohydrochlorin cobaltochelatase [Peptoniphilus sp.]|nr:sirohydrochlorin cobaltochelatase [Peptoniphilus sp.]MDY3118576.1 sirohydrochlorin cobaltochelatase [Peptoniphilus sp.]
MKKALIIATFGSTHEDALRRDLDPVVEELKKAAAGFDVRVTFTSRMVIRRYENKTGMRYANEVEAVEALTDEGFEPEAIFLQPLHLIEGFEYAKLSRLKERGIHVGEALFHDEEDVAEFVKSLDFRFQVPTVFVGHGSDAPADKYYGDLNSKFREEKLPHRVCTIEGAIDEKEPLDFMKEKGYTEVQLAPLLLLAGDHAKNDVFGEKGSVKTRFEQAGISVKPVEGGMGSWDFVRAMYVRKLLQLLGDDVCEN